MVCGGPRVCFRTGTCLCFRWIFFLMAWVESGKDGCEPQLLCGRARPFSQRAEWNNGTTVISKCRSDERAINRIKGYMYYE